MDALYKQGSTDGTENGDPQASGTLAKLGRSTEANVCIV